MSSIPQITDYDSIINGVRQDVPNVWTRLKKPMGTKDNLWIDFMFDNHYVAVECSPNKGFGVSSLVEDDGYGEGPDYVYTDISDVVDRVIELLQKPTEE